MLASSQESIARKGGIAYAAHMLSVILPTYNEAENLPKLLKRITAALAQVEHEIIVVDDDSPDGTWSLAEQLRESYPALRVVRRTECRGLSSAVVAGFGIAAGDVLAVMDSDLQHDPSLLTELYHRVQSGAVIAVASRYMEGGSVGEWVTGRRLLSKAATYLAQHLPPVYVSDPMSGFFAIQADAYRAIAKDLHPAGFKILLEILAHLPSGTVAADIPLAFQPRIHGESKLSLSVELAFLWQISRIVVHRFGTWIVWTIFAVLAIVLLWRAWPMLRLYTDAHIRSLAAERMQQFAAEEGMPLSGMLVRRVSKEALMLELRSHHRGKDERRCIILPLDASLPSAPCDA